MVWVRAIHTAQQELRQGEVRIPVLLMHASESVRPGDTKEKYYRADAILVVESISRYGRKLSSDVTEIDFKGGLHDLDLSKKEIRENMYRVMLDRIFYLQVQN